LKVSFHGTAVRFTFDVPLSSSGEQRPPGEVSTAQLEAASAGASANTHGVATLDDPFCDPDAAVLRKKRNELILVARGCAGWCRVAGRATGDIAAAPRAQHTGAED
jgi:hypothetical protein